jgi:arylsulfatase A-like enzyme
MPGRWIVVLALMLGSCGQPRGEALRLFQRLEPKPVPGAPALRDEVGIALFEIASELDRWRVEAPDSHVRAVPGVVGDDGARLLQLTAREKKDVVRLHRRGSFQTGRFNQLRVTMTYSGSNFGYLRASFSRDGETMVESTSVAVTETDTPRVFTLDLPGSGQPGLCDTLTLSVGGAVRQPGFLAVELVRVPLTDLLPDPTEAPRMVVVGTEARRGAGIVAGRPLASEVVVPRGSRLAFSFAQPKAIQRMSRPSGLAVVLEAGSVTRRVECATRWAGQWSYQEVELDEFSGRRLTIRFEVDADPDQAAWALAEAAIWAPGPPRPSVLLVTTDTHRADHIGAATGSVDISTPVLDELAARGVLFEDCFAPTNVTNPSHMALMTGTHPRDIGIVVNRRPLGGQAATLAELYREAGYATHAVVSTMHLGNTGSGLGQGFDRMVWPAGRPRRSGLTLDIATEWLEDVTDRPIFLWLHVFDAHAPYDPPEEFSGLYYDSEKDPFDPSLPDPGLPENLIPPGMPGLRDLEFPRALYKGEVSYLDHELGRVLRSARFGSGIVAVVGDHGEALGNGSMFFAHGGLYPETVRVPLIMAWPGGPAALHVQAPVTHLDVGRTLLDVSGLADASFPGRSLLRFVGSEPRRSEPRFLLSSSALSASVQHGNLYLILHLQTNQNPWSSRAYEMHEVEVFDLAADPDCRRDLLEERMPTAGRMRARLISWLESARPMGWAADAIVEPEFVEQLQQLGYVHQEPNDRPLWEDDRCGWCRRFP